LSPHSFPTRRSSDLDRKHLHQHLIAQLEFVADVADALLSNLADVKQPIRAGKDLDKGAEFGQAHDLAEVSLADLGGGGDLADHRSEEHTSELQSPCN